MKKTFVLLVLLLLIAGAVGVTINGIIFLRNSISGETALKGPHSFADPVCRSAYLNLFERDSVDIAMVFGYKDARPARFVDDRYEQMIFVQRITSDCSGDREDCGFKLESGANDERESYAKMISGPGGTLKTVRITVAQSSVGPDDVQNRANPFQDWQSKYAEAEFDQALKFSDIVFYNGHSRSGGGPDFFPPKLDHHEHVDYPWYKTQEESLKKMGLILEDPGAKLKMLGLFSCASDRLFTKRVEKAKAGIGLISSVELIYFADALENSLNAISALLEMKCRPDLDGMLKAGTKLDGFLPKAAKPRDHNA